MKSFKSVYELAEYEASIDVYGDTEWTKDIVKNWPWDIPGVVTKEIRVFESEDGLDDGDIRGIVVTEDDKVATFGYDGRGETIPWLSFVDNEETAKYLLHLDKLGE